MAGAFWAGGVFTWVRVFCQTSMIHGYLHIYTKVCTTEKRSSQIIGFFLCIVNNYVLSIQKNLDKTLFLSTGSSARHEEKGVGLLFNYLLAGGFHRVVQSNQR
jgi:hypothetical protein